MNSDHLTYEALREQLPSYLAIPIQAFLVENNPRVKLQWLVDCAEIAVRWVAALNLAQVLDAHQGILPKKLVKQLRNDIRRPTLGQWLNILRSLGEHLYKKKPESSLCPDSFSLHEQAFDPLFKKEDSGGNLSNSLLVLRNNLAHGLGMSDTAAQIHLQNHTQLLLQLLQKVSEATQSLRVYYVSANGTQEIHGVTPQTTPPEKLPNPLREVESGTWLFNPSSEQKIKIYPLAHYDYVHHINAQGLLEPMGNEHAVQLYQGMQKKHVAYVPIGRDESITLHTNLDAFTQLFQLNPEPDKSKATSIGIAWDAFLEEASSVAADLVGRKKERGIIHQWLHERDTRKDGVIPLGVVFGSPGMGKSLLMASIVHDLRLQSGNEARNLYYHRFRAGDTRNSWSAFLDGLQAALYEWGRLPPNDASNDDADENFNDAIQTQRLKKRLQQIAEVAMGEQVLRFIIVIDGLDEVLPLERRIMHKLQDLAVPGSVWLLAGRPEQAIKTAIDKNKCNELLGDQGLDKMSQTEIREMLLKRLPPGSKAKENLILKDVYVGDKPSNEFIERLAGASEGLPLYVHYVLQDIMDGKVKIEDNQSLPAGLDAYYNEVVGRLGISDIASDVPKIIAALALAKEPLTEIALAQILADTDEQSECEEFYLPAVSKAIPSIDSLLRLSPTPEDKLGYSLYHQSFRDFVLSEGSTIARNVKKTHKIFCNLAAIWDELPADTGIRNHLFRWGVRYALESGIEKQTEAAHASASQVLLFYRLTPPLYPVMP